MALLPRRATVYAGILVRAGSLLVVWGMVVFALYENGVDTIGEALSVALLGGAGIVAGVACGLAVGVVLHENLHALPLRLAGVSYTVTYFPDRLVRSVLHLDGLSSPGAQVQMEFERPRPWLARLAAVMPLLIAPMVMVPMYAFLASGGSIPPHPFAVGAFVSVVVVVFWTSSLSGSDLAILRHPVAVFVSTHPEWYAAPCAHAAAEGIEVPA